MSNCPFVGPRPFEKEDSDRFFGRTRETEELLSLIIAHRAVLVYAQSGAGKTSLLRAGVIKHLEEQQYVILPPARVQGLLPNGVLPESVQNIFVFHVLQYWAAKLPTGQSIKDHVKTTLSEFLTLLAPAREAGEECPRPLVVIFDQFEEFFTTNAHRWQERRPFFEQLTKALQDLPALKVVFVMREEYIAQLDPFIELLPEKLRTRMHLERLRGNSARNAVVKPFQKWGLSFDPTAADEMMAELSEIRVPEGDKFRETHGEFVEPVQLQVVCQSLWENLPVEWRNGADANKDSPPVITSEYVGRFGDVNEALGRYYDRSVKKAAAEGNIGEGELRRWINTALITRTGTRGLAFRGASGAPGTIPGLALKCLEEAHVIRREERGGMITHELTHDRFIEPVQKSNKAWLADYDAAEKIRAKLEERAVQNPDEILDELALREAEEYLTSPVAKILGATAEARQLVRRSRKELDEAKKRQAEELEDARQRAKEEERLHKAESERVKLLLEKRKRERIFSATVFLLGVVLLIAIGLFINQKRKEYKADKERLQKLIETGRIFRDKAKADLRDETNPTKEITALRNLALALNCNPRDTEAASLASNLLLKRVWCPPAAPEVRYQKDALLAATFAPGGSNNEIFAAAGNGQLLFWKGRELSPVCSLFEKPKPGEREVVQIGFASFSPDGRWLVIIPPTLAPAANADAAAQGPPQQATGGAGPPASGHETCKLQIWRWSPPKRTYESAGEDLQFQRLRGSRMTFAWSNESDRLVLINARGTNEAECAFFQVEGTFRELVNRSRQLTDMKIVALAFALYHSGMAAVSLEPAGPLRKVTLFEFSGDYLQILPMYNGKPSILLSEGFQPNGIAFGPGDSEITLMMWNSVRILNLLDGNVTPVPPPTFRDQFMRLVVGPGDVATRLVATSLGGRVHVAKGARRQEPAEPVIFRGPIGIPQFSSDGQRLLILSGMWNAFDSLRLIDVSPVYRTWEAAPESLEEKPAPPWLADIAATVSALDTSSDGSLLTLETVRERYPESKAGDPYEAVWKRFFPDDPGTYQR